MKLSISEKYKKDILIAIFQILKNCTSIICLTFNDDHLYIQGMDKSHVCLFDIKIMDSWFHSYQKESTDNNVISFDTHIFHTIINTNQESHSIILHYEGNPDSLNIDLIAESNTKGDFNKYFKIPLADFEYQQMNIPETDYDAEFSMSSKKIYEITSQMLVFGTDINIKCTEEKIDLITNGVTGEMLVNIPIDDLNEFSISEGDTIDLKYSLNYVHKMCLTNKLSTNIEFAISGQFPMRIKYDLGDDSCVKLYIAPKIEEG